MGALDDFCMVLNRRISTDFRAYSLLFGAFIAFNGVKRRFLNVFGERN